MNTALLFALLGYLSGSVLYTRVYAALFDVPEASKSGKDGNPGTANAFKYGGFRYGLFVLLGDIFKTLIPVALYFHLFDFAPEDPLLGLVIAAPVIGHVFPLFSHFHGGKGIAATFGSLLGIFPVWQPAVLLAVLFITFAAVIRIRPNYYMTMVVYCLFFIGSFLIRMPMNFIGGMAAISFTVLLKLVLSAEERTALEVNPVWKH